MATQPGLQNTSLAADTDGVNAGRLVLASGSPRRRELATALATEVETLVPTGEETPPRKGESPQEFVLRLSEAKASEVAALAKGSTVLAADTAVVLGDTIMGKPADRDEAVLMLRTLRGRTHQVVTGVTVLDSVSNRRMSTAKATDVTMRHYTDAEVQRYTATETPYDKAGAYAIQDTHFSPVKAIRGCYLNVVGLPLCEAVTLLDAMGAPAALKPDWRVPEQCAQCPLATRQEAGQT